MMFIPLCQCEPSSSHQVGSIPKCLPRRCPTHELVMGLCFPLRREIRGCPAASPLAPALSSSLAPRGQELAEGKPRCSCGEVVCATVPVYVNVCLTQQV